MYIPRTGRLNRGRFTPFKQKLIKFGIIAVIGIVLFGFVASFGLFAWYARDLPSPGKLSQIAGSSTVFLDRDDKVLFDMYKDKNRVPVGLKEIPANLKNATIAIEDKNFYKHEGVSELGMVRAFFNVLRGKGLQSGSTITQQLIKNALLTSQQSASRKIKEIILAREVEKRYTKDEILEMYLNEAPYGGSYWGVGSAAKGYFGKSPKDLTLVESAIIAGLPQSPSVYSPYIGSKEAWKNRATDVLRRMREDKYITREQEQTALKQLNNVTFSSPKLAINAPHFVFYVRDQLEKEYGAKFLDQGVKIKTTVSLEVQNIVEKIVKEQVEKLKGPYHLTNSAVVVLDSQTNEILAMVGSYDFNDEEYGKFNAVLGLRQPGSAIKPVTYAAAFEKGYTPATVVMDLRTVFPQEGQSDYIPVNYDGKFRGPVQLRFALGNSFNIPAVKLLAMIGIKDFLQKANDMGLETLAPTQANLNRFGLALTLGGGETRLLDLTSAYSIFARGGTKKDLTSLTEIEDYKGKKIYQQVKSKEEKVLSPEVAFLISHILSDNNARIDEFGPSSYLRVGGKTVAVKSGTTDDKRDNWAVGYTKGITVGVWSGNNDNSPMNQRIASGATGASEIWYKLMVELLKKYPDGIMDKPEKVKAVTIDSYLGGLPNGGATRSEYFIEGTEPTDISPFYKKIKVSKSSGKLANDVEIRSGNYDEKDFIIITENDPVSTDGKNRWQEAIDAWAKEQGDSKFHPPTDTSDASSDVTVVQIKEPGDKTTVDSNDVTIKGIIASVNPIKNVKLYVNGSVIKNYDEDKKNIEEKINLSDGVYEIKLVATSTNDKTGDSVIRIGVKKPWDSTPTPAP